MKDWLRKRWKLVTGLGIAATTAFAVAAHHVYDTYQSNLQKAMSAAPHPDPDAWIAVTGGAGRVRTALTSAEADDKVLLSGCNSAATLEAICAANNLVLENLAVSPADTTLGYNALDTEGNALEIAHWLQQNPDVRNIVLITSFGHAPRLVEEMERVDLQGVNVTYQLVGDGPSFNLREALKTTWRDMGMSTGNQPLAEPYPDNN